MSICIGKDTAKFITLACPSTADFFQLKGARSKEIKFLLDKDLDFEFVTLEDDA